MMTRAYEKAGTVLAHMSDPHLPLPRGVPPRSVLNKRLLSLLSWHSKRRHDHLRHTLDRLVADLHSNAPDLIAVTGDLTNLGLDMEYRRARDWLDALGDPARVMVIPGNHEALVHGAWDRGAVHWRPYWQGDETAQENVPRAFPTLRRRGPLALIGVSSAIASPPGQAVGHVGDTQRARLATLLRQTRAEHLCRVVLIHHPPLDGTVAHRKRLRDAAELRAVLAQEGVELVLHGHSHKSHLQMLQTRDGSVPVVGVPSASSMHHEPAAYNLYQITPRAEGWDLNLTSRHLTADGRMEAGHCNRLPLARSHTDR